MFSGRSCVCTPLHNYAIVQWALFCFLKKILNVSMTSEVRNQTFNLTRARRKNRTASKKRQKTKTGKTTKNENATSPKTTKRELGKTGNCELSNHHSFTAKKLSPINQPHNINNWAGLSIHCFCLRGMNLS